MVLIGCTDTSPNVTPVSNEMASEDNSNGKTRHEGAAPSGAHTPGRDRPSPTTVLERFKRLPSTTRVIEEPDHADVGDEHLELLAKVDELSVLNLSGCGRITEVGLVLLASLSHLKTLRISRINATNAGVSAIANLASLETLDLALNDALTDGSLFALAKSSTLRDLNVEGCTGITDQGVAALAQCKSLRRLDLSMCYRVTPDGIELLLRDNSAIEELHLRATSMNDSLLRALEHATALKYVDVRKCKNLSEEQRRALVLKYPNIQFAVNDDSTSG